MSHDINPYEPPNAAIRGVATRGDNIVIDGKYLRVPREGAILASRCVKCNEPGARQLMRKLYWHAPWLYIMLVFPGVLFYVLVAMFVRKKAEVQVSLCERHVNLRRAGIAIGWGGVGAGVVALFVLPPKIGGLILLVALLLAPLTGLLMARVVFARRIDDTHAWLDVSRAFLASYQR